MHKCRICGWTGEAKQLTVREMMFNTQDEFQYFECAECHCLQIAEVPDNLEKYYGNTYYSYNSPLNAVREEKTQINETRVLDVGCGAGNYLCGLAEQGYVNLTGCDPFIEKDIEYDNGVKIFKCDIHEMAGEYDWINLNDSFEHVTDPHEVMTSIKRLLAPNGVAKMKLPIYPNIVYDMFGADWYQIDAPRHIFLHTNQSLQYLADKYNLKIVKKKYDSTITPIVYSYLYSKNVPFYRITQETVLEYFTLDELLEIQKMCETVNQNEYGDHAEFYFVHKN